MVPAPQERPQQEGPPASALDGHRVVISGISGLYPNSHHVKDLCKILYDRENPITDENPRWTMEHPELPKQLGKIPDLQTFDAQFFRVHYRLSNNMDPMSRKLLEQSYQALYDAGLSPDHLTGQKVGVFIGSCFSETEKACFYVADSLSGFGIAGCSKAMFANRISYWLNAKGPSMNIDAGCCSSIVALEKAYEAITKGECDAAIVGGANICLHPQSSVHFGRTMDLCMDGKTKCFDKDANGAARSEAISVLFLQKAKDAHRIYADVCYVKSKFDPLLDERQKQVYGPDRDPIKLTHFLNEFYDKVGISPNDVEYIEAYGSASQKADKSELQAIESVFCNGRSPADPLLIGSVMSNIGYTEAASGITAITKVLLGYHTGKIAGNLHFQSPREDVPALIDGRIRVVSEHQPIRDSYSAVNNLSITGVNAHVLLHGHHKPKDITRYQSTIPHLVPISARQESTVQNILDDLETRPVDPEEIALLHNIHEKTTFGHLGRGFTILGKNETGETVSLVKKVDYFNDAKRPLWFVYSGMGSQWAGMGTQLMKIPIFAAAIERCRKALEPKGLDIVNIITSPEKSTFDNILHSFVGIAAVQIGLTDVLRAVGIKPDMIIGHSVGELGCAYADGCFTAEEMILAAYYRGLVSVQTPFIKGSMAAVGLGFNQVKSMCPPEVEVACHNGQDSSTISGPADIMKEFVGQLTAKGVFAKEVPCSNIAYHSRYIKEAGPGLLKHLSELITDPKPRSERWVSTSVPQEKWEIESAKFSSAEYHTNNLLSPVLFEETSRLVPPNAVLIEIAPHGLLQAILKRSLSAACVNIPMTRRGHADNALFVLEALGQLYIQGFNLEARALYPQVEFPVSTGTPMLSHLVEWAHNEKWNVPLYMAPTKTKAAAFKNIISVYDNDHEYLKGHVIKNEMRYPYAAALVAVWDTLAMTKGLLRQANSVQFRDVYFYNQPKMVHDKLLRINVQIQKGSGYFEVMDDTSKILSGYVTTDLVDLPKYEDATVSVLDEVKLSSEDVYKTLFDRQMHYRDEFRSIQSVSASMTQAQLSWTGNWVTFLDSIIQLNALREEKYKAIKPKYLYRLTINIEEHERAPKIQIEEGLECIEANIVKEFNVTRCGGVTTNDFMFGDAKEKELKLLSLKALEFVPYFQLNSVEASEALNIFLQMITENMNNDVINVLEILSSENSFSLQYEIMNLINEFDNVTINFEQINVDNVNLAYLNKLRSADLIITQQITTSNNMCELLYKTARQDIFVLTLDMASPGSLPTALSRVVASTATPKGRFILARWRPASSRSSAAAVTVTDASDFAMLKATKQKLAPDQSLLILSKYPPVQGLRELVQEWRKLSPNNKINVAMINSKNFRDVNFDQLSNFDLAFNVLKDGIWGGEYFVQNKDKVPIDNPVALRSRITGDLESLYWEEASGPGLNDIAVAVHYAGLNYRDAKKAIGAAPIMPNEDSGYGMDFSGVTIRNERVMGLVRGSAAKSIVKAEPSLLWPIPAHWTMEDAATVPLPYAHAFYLLGIKSSLAAGSRIMVHGAAGGLGQAVLAIALAYKCTVFATVSDTKKKRFLKKLFPAIPEEHIGNSRDSTFTDMVLSATKGKGCHIVITCLPANLKDLALHCCGMSGITLDTHQITTKDKYAYGMFHMTSDRAYIQVDLSSIFRPENASEMKKIQLMVSEGIAKGYVRPLSRVCYKWSEAARGLRLLAASQHRGRALLNLQGADPITQPKLSISSAASQIVVDVDDKSALACKLIDTLVERGAKNVIFHAADNAVDGYVHMKIKSWENSGVQVKLSSENLTNIAKVEQLANISQKMGPIESIFIVGTETQDVFNKDNISLVINNLDSVSRKLSNSLKYFAVLSGKGNVGREVCLSRANDDLAATLVILPPIEKHQIEHKEIRNSTLDAISSSDALIALEMAVKVGQPVVLVNARRPPTATLLQHVSSIAGITISDKLQDEQILDQIIADNDKFEAIAVYLAQNIDITLSKEDVAALSIGKLREMEILKTMKKNEETKGLNIYFNYVDPDELTATVNIVPVATLTHQPDRDEGLDNNETYIVMIPGLDGHYRKLESFSQRLKLPAFVLQGGCDNNNETVEEMALRFSKTMMKYLNMKDNFYILGYSFGALVALEVASNLEKHGHSLGQGVVFCIDAEPDTFKTMLKTNLGCFGAQLEDAVIQHMYSLMVGENSAQLDEMLKKASSWQEKIAVSVRALRGKVPHSTDYAGLMIETAYGRIQQALKYDGKQLRLNPLRSQIIYLRSTSQPFEKVENISLAQYSQRPLKVYDLTKDHAHALEDLRSANIINKHLDNNILETFSKRNLCDSNFLNITRFYTNNE